VLLFYMIRVAIELGVVNDAAAAAAASALFVVLSSSYLLFLSIINY
jgi:hypothetical protein